MNRKTLYITAGIIVLLLVGVWIYSSSKNKNALVESQGTETQVDTDTTNTQSPTATTPAKINIFKQNGNYTCVYEEVKLGRHSTNTLYISDGKFRGEFRTIGIAGTIMLYDGNYLYTWIEGAKVGLRTTFKSASQLPLLVPNDLTSGQIVGSSSVNQSWDCHSWNKNAALLVAPKGVTFAAN